MKAGIAGGIDAAVKAICTHIDNVGVCEWGCGALKNVIGNNGKSINNTYNHSNKLNEQLITKSKQEQ